MSRIRAGLSGFSLCFFTASALLAGSLAAPGARAQAPDTEGLDEVVVTARKREENLQDVSLSITAIPAQEIERLNITSVAEVAKLDASLIYDKGYSATDNRISVRGLSATRGRVNVAVLVDGIDTSSESIAFGGGSLLATNKLLDLQSIEIVKGPQSALYGRSAFAGAIQYVTKDPSDEFEGSVRGEFGDAQRYELVTSLSGPVNENFGLRFNGLYWNQGGFYRNSITGRKVGDGDGWGAALTGKWTPSDAVSIKTRLEFTDDRFGQSATAQAPVNTIDVRPVSGTTCLAAPGAPMSGPCAAGTARVYAPTSTVGVFPGSNHVYGFRGVVPDADQLAVRLDPDARTGRDYLGSRREILRGSIVVDWEVGPGTLTSLTGYTDANFSFLEDGDFDAVGGRVSPFFGPNTDFRAARFDYDNQTKQISQEIRWRSDFDGPVNFMGGALYWNEDADQVARSVNIFCLTALPMGGLGGGFPFTAVPPACSNGAALNPTIFPANQVLGQMIGIPRDNGREIDHKSVFAMVEYQVSESWKLTFEGRYADETETVRGPICALGALPSVTGGSTPCADPSFQALVPFGPPPTPPTRLGLFSVFGPSVNYLYPYFDAFPPANGIQGVRQAPGNTVELESDHSYFAPRVTVDFKPTEDSLVYFTWAKAVKPGGFSTVTGGSWQDADFDGNYDEFRFDDEKLTEYEIGAKTEWLGGRLRFNPAVFLIDYKDKQVGAQLVTPSGTLVGRLLNAGKAEVRGLELDVQWQATDHWFFALNYAYLDSEFTDFPFTSGSSTDASRFGDCPRGPDARLCYINLKGNRLERAPKSSVVGLARWTTPIADLLGSSNARFYVEGDVQSQSSRFIDIWNNNELPSYTQGSIRFGLLTDAWDLTVYVNNVTDDDTVLTGNSNPGDVAQALADPTNFSPADTVGVTLPDPRHYGVRFNYKFAGN